MNRAAYEEDFLVCPKPRPLHRYLSHQNEISDSKAGMELLDIILSKGNYAAEEAGIQMASSPPFFSGSPPRRVSNPLAQDALFGNVKIMPLSPSLHSPSPSPSSARIGGGCGRMIYGHKPAPVRVEGFDCLNRDGRHCSISGIA